MPKNESPHKAKMTNRKPPTHNIKLKPYQETKHPFGKPVTFEEIRVFGEETAELFATEEAKRVAADTLKKKKRTPYVADNAVALKMTGQLAASPLMERWQKKSDNIFRMVNAYYYDRTSLNKNLSYREMEAVKYMLDPEQREDALQKLVEYAQTKEKKKMLRPIIKIGLTYKINLPLDGLSDMMSARDLLRFLQNKAAVTSKEEMTNDVVKAQFADLTVKAFRLKSAAAKRNTYLAMAEILPCEEDAQALRNEAAKLKPAKTMKKKSGEKAPDLNASLKDLEKRIADDKAQPTDESKLAILASFDEIDEKAVYLDAIGQSKTYERLAVLHPDKVEASFYFDRAVEATNAVDSKTVKATRFKSLRFATSDKNKRVAAHQAFLENASFNTIVTDAVSLLDTKTENDDMLKVSNQAILEQKDISLARKNFYQQHRQTLHKATLGWQWKW